MKAEKLRAACPGAAVAVALCCLIACNSGPAANASAAGSAATSVTEAVRVATDRSGMQQGVVVLPNGERMRRVTLPNGFSHVMVGRMGPDGRPSVACVDSAPAAESFLSGGAAGGQGSGQ